MGALNKKLWRTIVNTKGQFLAVVAVVMVGVAVYISMSTAYFNLSQSKDSFYQANNFADYYFNVIKAPQQITRQIQEVPGVAAVTGRIQKDITLVNQHSQRATARLTSYSAPVNRELNSIVLMSGRFFTETIEATPGSEGSASIGEIEVLVDPQYATGNNLSFNDTISVVAQGRKVPLTMVGTASGPEFVYLMKDAATILPDPTTFGVIMISRDKAQQILDMSGQINQILISLSPGANETEVVEQIEAILEPYGNLANYPRKDQLSNAMLESELDGIRTSSQFMPVIFLAVAAAIQFVILGRMVRSQRLQIGVMKALGYHNRQVIMHYTGYALLVALFGNILGVILGLAMATVISNTYAMFFNLPATIGAVNTQAIMNGFMLSIIVSLVAGLTACRSVVDIIPAESMRPEPPKVSSRTLVEEISFLWQRLDTSWKMSLRSVARNKGRLGVTVMGVVFAVGMLIVSLFTMDAVDYMINSHFYKNQNYNYLIHFTSPIKEHELLNISRHEEVYAAEPLLELPVKLTFNGKNEDAVLTGLIPGAKLKKITGEGDQLLEIPETGMLLSQNTATKLGIKVGDLVEVETMLSLGPPRNTQLKVYGINKEFISGGSFVSLEQANRILQEQHLVSGVMLKINPATGETLEKKLEDMTEISSILSRQREMDNFNQSMDTMLYFVFVMVLFALLLGFAIVYNSSAISFSERQRELASLRVLGFTNKEVSGILLKENLLQSLLGVALGLPFGYLIVKAYTNAISTDLFTLPAIIYPITYLYAALGGISFIIMGHLLAVRGVKKLQLVEVLKNKD